MYDVEERRQVFWELVVSLHDSSVRLLTDRHMTVHKRCALAGEHTYEHLLYRMITLRPSAISNRHTDTKLPESDELFLADEAGCEWRQMSSFGQSLTFRSSSKGAASCS